MKLVDFLTSPWAIMPEKLLEIQAIYATHLRGEKIDLEAIEARLGRALANDQQDYRIEGNGVAVLPISGVISNKANMMTKISGGASAQLLEKQVQSLRADPAVRAVVLDFDTPGGSVLGIPALADAISALAAEKPTVSCCTGTMASAGYWTGSAANAVYISGLTDYVGSIGVVATHNYNPRGGQSKTTEITAGKFKRMATDSAPLTAEGQAYIQAQVDEIYRVFVETVAKNRKVSPDAVLANMADGKVFIGRQAIDAGLVDGVATVDQMVEKLSSNPQQYATRRKAVFAPSGGSSNATALAGVASAEAVANDEPVLHVEISTIPQGETMNPEEIVAKFEAENAEAAALIRAAGAASERDRIKAVREQNMPGHEALIESLAFDGKTTGPEAAVAVLAAEKAVRASFVEGRAADAPKPVAQEPSESGDAAANDVHAVATGHAGYVVEANSAKLDAEAKAYIKQHPGTAYIDAVRAVSK